MQEEEIKSGIVLTKAIRKVKVDHEDEISQMNADIRQLVKKQAYSKLAFWIFDQYVRFGKLDTVLKEADYDEGHFKKGNLDTGFDYKLMDECLAKYGMECNNVKGHCHYYNKDDPTEWNLSCVLHEEDVDNDSEDMEK